MEVCMRKNIARVLLYAACAVLVVFYILVLWWGKNPKVGTEYRMYYLTHELTDWPGYGNLKYTFGTKDICTEHKDRNGKEQSNVCSRKGQGPRRHLPPPWRRFCALGEEGAPRNRPICYV